MVDPESVARRYNLFSKVVLEVLLDIAGTVPGQGIIPFPYPVLRSGSRLT